MSPTFIGTGRQRALETAQHGLDAGDEFARAEGLGDVVVGAEFETEDAVGFAALRGQKNYGHGGEAGRLANGAADFQTVFAGNHDVEHEERGALAFGVGEHVGARGIHAHDEPFVFQVMADEAGNVGIVFDDEQAWFHEDYCNEGSTQYLAPSSEFWEVRAKRAIYLPDIHNQVGNAE